MHRTTPLAAAFRAYVAGGARSVVSAITDTTGLQEMAGHFMANESRDKIESPQNFGFTSAVMDAIQDQAGKIMGSAETFIQFMGGNRSFPVAGNMDDRRHRLTGLDKGDVGMFTTKGRKQQLHMSADGMFGSAPQDKTMRFALVAEDSEQDMTSQSFQKQAAAAMAPGGGGRPVLERLMRAARGLYDMPSVSTLDAGGGGAGGGGAGGAAGDAGAGGQQKGQQALKDKNKKAKIFFDLTKDKTRTAGKEVHLMQDDDNTYLHVKGKKLYLGAEAGKGKFAIVVTLKGPAKTKNNVMGNIG